MNVNNGKMLDRLVRAGAQYAAEQRAAEVRENGTAKKSDPFTVGVVATVMGGLMLLLTGQIFVLPLLISGLISLGYGAAVRQRKKASQGTAETETVPQSDSAAKKLAEQKQFLDSGLISKEEFDENCAKIRAKEKIQ